MNPSEKETAMKPTPGSPGEHEHAGETYILRHGDTLYRVTAASARDAKAEVLAYIDDPDVADDIRGA